VYTIIEAPTRGWARLSTLGGFAAIGGFCTDDFFRPTGAHCPWSGVRHFHHDIPAEPNIEGPHRVNPTKWSTQ